VPPDSEHSIRTKVSRAFSTCSPTSPGCGLKGAGQDFYDMTIFIDLSKSDLVS
jgi:hypothetical protein